MKRKMLDRNLFTRRVIPQENRYSLMSATIHPDGRFSMHGKLAGKLDGVALGIIFTADVKNFILAEAKDDGDAITFPKNGSKILPSALEIVKKGKLPLPVQYEVWLGEDGIWQGDDMENPTVPLAGKRHGSEKASAACRGNIYSRHAALPERTDDRGRPAGYDPLLLRGLEPIPPESGRTCPKGDCRGHKRHTTGGEIFRWNRAMGTAIRLRENGLTFPIGKHGANDRRVISGRDAARESRSRTRPQADGMDMKLPNRTPRGDYLPGVSFIP